MNDNNLIRYFFFLATSIVIIAGLKIASEILVILFLAIFIASILSSLLTFLKNKNIPIFFAYIVSLSILILLSLLLAYVINISLKDFIENLPSYETRINELIVDSIIYIEQTGYKVNKDEILQALNFSSFVGFTTNIIGSIGTFLSKFVLVIIGVAFILAEAKSIQTKLKIIFQNNAQKLQHVNLFSKNIQKYFLVKTFTSFLTGFIITLILMYFNVDYPILWGVIAALFNFVPVVGSIIASVPAIVLALMNLDINSTIYITVLYVIINISISNILEPKLMGKELGLSPLVIFFSLILWGWILGIVGMFLAVPITMTLKIAFDSNSETKWIGIMMSNLAKKQEKKRS
ncbi:membrane protein [Malaciobacter pacificus]|uniref:Putative autoinducer 2 (AI-2E family) transporter n=1 Tax=Malaciobacter pacificus TaxID=1080223 RepID=A0A5C2H625_9BACT|nr:AI-2E family transporter [Malaciobacter pacificus]QEP34410.1 putative autoinducer 2 (AI-2E family) transporter [Malaciobacter pacificus]GGD45255.1 membrane protein [Malaciobacter pacificus]